MLLSIISLYVILFLMKASLMQLREGQRMQPFARKCLCSKVTALMIWSLLLLFGLEIQILNMIM